MAPTPKKHKAEWDALCRRSIQEAVVRLLSREDAGAVTLTMDRVAAEAGLAKGTLYLYFKNKQQLLTAVKDEALRPMWEELAAIVDGALPPAEKLARFVTRHLGYFDEHRELFRVLLWDRQIAETTLRRQQSLPFRGYVEQVARIFEEGTGAGVFRPLDPQRLAAMLVEADIVMIGRRFAAAAPGPPDADARLVVDLFLNGVAARPAAGRMP
ncbi:MAG: TetR/AcrR family transcriptional regulator [Candidatus Krumholzibacteriia bacterium]